MSVLKRILARPGETLTAHTREVLTRVGELAQLRPLPAYPRLYGWVGWAALLHDSGKLATGFQRGLRSCKHRWGLRHEVLSLAFATGFDFTDEDRAPILAAIATHHRDLPFILDTYRPHHDPEDDLATALIRDLDPALAREWRDWLVAEAGRWPLLFPAAARPFAVPTPDDIHAALTLLDSWGAPIIEEGSAHPAFVEATLVRGTMLLADHAGSARARPFARLRLDVDALRPAQPYPHQTACEAAGGEARLLLAPTSAGKTEGALLWTAAGAPPRLFYLLPYRVSMDAMARRLEPFLPPGDVSVQHGKALISLYRRLLNEGETTERADAEARARLALARLHVTPARVTSPYHILRAAYGFKGFEALLTDLYGAAVVVDEIHAYHPSRLALILETLAFLRRHFAARLLLMTATLPPAAARALDVALPGLRRIEASLSIYRDFRRHRLVMEPGDLMDTLANIVARAAGGDGTLITVNTVRRARAAAARLRAMGADVLLLHGRFNGRDRTRHERRLLALFGVDAPPSDAPRPLVVATQVVEVSLNLDFDTLHTDPAPLDALLQRFGRVNRARRQMLADVHVYAEPTGADDRHPVYPPALVASTLAALVGRDDSPIDEAGVTDWLREAYTPFEEEWDARYAEAREEFHRAVLDDLRPFESADVGLLRRFAQLFDGADALPLTLDDEYRGLLETDPLGAAGLLVPLAWWQIKMLETQGRAWPEDDLFIVDAPYDPDTGLQLEDDAEA